jgi:hypothetical protein
MRHISLWLFITASQPLEAIVQAIDHAGLLLGGARPRMKDMLRAKLSADAARKNDPY